MVNNTPVSQTDTRKCQGVHIDEKLTWEDSHIDMICKTFNESIGVMKRHVGHFFLRIDLRRFIRA